MQLDALAFGAHPDDVELSCAGTLIKLKSKGYETGVIALTRGELGTRGSETLRAQEFQAAAQIIGLSTQRILDIPDGQVEVNWDNKVKVIREIRANRPKIVFAPYWEDRHPDHAHASRLVRDAAYLAGLKKIETEQEVHRPHRVIYYPCRFEFEPSFVVDVTDSYERKLEAIQSYKSQFHNPEKNTYGKEETNISRPEFLEAIIVRDRKHGSSIGVKYGEAFLVREPLPLDDPVGVFGPASLDGFL